MNGFKVKYFTGRKNQSGATLVIIIMALVVLAVIGLAIYSLTSTALLNQVAAQRTAQAIYLAESGIRVVASEYKAATSTTDADSKLSNLNTRTFSLPSNGGNFAVNIYPYWFYYANATNIPANSNVTSITLNLPGSVPPIDADASTTNGVTPITFPTSGSGFYGNLKKKDTAYLWALPVLSYYCTSNCSPPYTTDYSGTPVTFHITNTGGVTFSISTGDEFYLGYVYTSTQTTSVNQGENLIIDIDTADANDLTANFFPPQKGTIFVEQSVELPVGIYQYKYDSRSITTSSTPHTVTLTNIQPVSGASALFPLVVGNTPIYMGKSLGIRSTSTYGN